MAGPGAIEMSILMLMSGLFSGTGFMGLPPGERDKLLVQCPPSKAVIYTEWAERSSGKPGGKGIDGFAGDPEIRTLFANIEKAIKTTIEKESANAGAEERAFGKAMPTIIKILLSRSGCMYASFQPQPGGNGAPGIPNFVAALNGVKATFVVNGGKDADTLAKHLSDLLALLPADMRKKNIDRQPLPIPMPGGSLTLHRHKDYFILGFGKGTVDQAVAGLTGKSKGLLDNPRFVAAAKQVEFERTAVVTWVDIETAVKQAGGVFGPQVQAIVKMIGADPIGHIVMSTGVVDGEIRSKSYISTGGKTEGILALVSGRAIKPADLAHVPADADALFSVSVNAPKILATVKQVVGAADPGSKAFLDELLKQFEKELGVSIEKDLFAAFGDVWVVHNSKSAGGLFLTSVVGSLEIRDHEKAHTIYTKLMEILDGALPGEIRGGFRRRGVYLKRQQFMGQTIHYVNTIGDDVPFAPAFCLTNKHLMIAPHPQALKAQLRFLKSSEPNFTTHFDKKLKLPEGELICFSYFETKRMLRTLYAFAPYMAQIFFSEIQREVRPPESDLNPRSLDVRKLFSSFTAICAGAVFVCLSIVGPLAAAPKRPNILWITCEDISAHIGCYGDPNAKTPNIDRLASQGVRYTHAFSVAGVCAPTRSCIITGMYPTSIGTHHMRCKAVLPKKIRCFTEYLREAGYYCTNNSKTDYNFRHSKSAWDASSRKAHWRNRKDQSQPFFSVFNFTVCHESKIRAGDDAYRKLTSKLKPDERQSPGKLPLPPYYPDTPTVRKDWARNYELITATDYQVGRVLKELKEDGLDDSTIVFFYSDHGVGLPRAKRWLYDSGMHVPFVVRWPGQLKPGTVTDRLVSFVDLAPTVLSLAGVTIPDHLQGRPFLGSKAQSPREFVFAARDRMDERYDICRAVRDKRYKYIRNYEPFKPYAQYMNTPEGGPTMKELRRLQASGGLTGATRHFMAATKPAEELYDTTTDPHEVRNLISDPKHRAALDRLRAAHIDWTRRTIDVGLLPEPEIEARAGSEGIYAIVRRKGHELPIARLRHIAALGNEGPQTVAELTKALHDDEPAIRHWAAVGLDIVGKAAATAVPDLKTALKDSSPAVRIAAAQTLCHLGNAETARPVLVAELQHKRDSVRITAANALDAIGNDARPVIPALNRAMKDDNKYVVRVVNHTLNPDRSRYIAPARHARFSITGYYFQSQIEQIGAMKFDELDRRMRIFETASDLCVLPGVYMVARLDGRSFTRLTKDVIEFDVPFDARFRDLMVDTTESLMTCGFQIVYAYTESDEISLLFTMGEQQFGRKLRKFNSTLAGEASAKFSLLLGEVATFDCRISQLPGVEAVVDYFRWRNEDAARNALNSYCYWTLRQQGLRSRDATNRLLGLSAAQKNELLFECGLNFNTVPNWQKRGVGLFWEEFDKTGCDPQTGRQTTTRRRRIARDYDLPMKDDYSAYMRSIVATAE
eukprot:g26560.t1